MITIFFSRLHSNAILPSKRSEDAGYDIYPCFDEDYILIPPHKTISIPTGIASCFSRDYYIQLVERGSTGIKGIAQRCGVIDSGYRGEWFVPITNTNDISLYIIKSKFLSSEDVQEKTAEYIIYPAEKAICQAVVLPVPLTQIKEITYENLLKFESKRASGKLGSSLK